MYTPILRIMLMCYYYFYYYYHYYYYYYYYYFYWYYYYCYYYCHYCRYYYYYYLILYIYIYIYIYTLYILLYIHRYWGSCWSAATLLYHFPQVVCRGFPSSGTSSSTKAKDLKTSRNRVIFLWHLTIKIGGLTWQKTRKQTKDVYTIMNIDITLW